MIVARAFYRTPLATRFAEEHTARASGALCRPRIGQLFVRILLGTLILHFGLPRALPQSGAAASSDLVLQTGHTSGVLAATVSSDGQWVASVDAAGNLKVWDVVEERVVRTFPLPGAYGNLSLPERLQTPDAPISLVFAKDSSWLAVASPKRSLVVFTLLDTKQRQVSATAGITGLALSPGGDQLAVRTTSGPIEIWDTRSWQKVKDLVGPRDSADILTLTGAPGITTLANREVAFSPDGSRIVAASLNAVVQTWRTTDWASEGTVSYGDNKTIYTFVAVDSRGGGIATGDMGQPNVKVQRGPGRTLLLQTGLRVGDVSFLAASEDLSLIAVTARNLAAGPGGGSLSMFAESATGYNKLWSQEPSVRSGLGFSRGFLIAMGQSIELLDPRSQRVQSKLAGSVMPVIDAIFGPNGNDLLLIDTAGAVRKLDSTLGRVATVMNADVGRRLRFSTNGSRIISEPPLISPYARRPPNTQNAPQIPQWQILDTAGRQVAQSFTLPPFSIAAVSDDGRYLVRASAGTNMTVNVARRDLQNGVDEPAGITHTQNVSAIAISRTGKYYASASLDSSLRLWRTGGPISLQADGVFLALAFSGDERLLAGVNDRGEVWEWDVASGMGQRMAPSASANGSSVAFSNSGRWLAAGRLDGTILIFDLQRMSSTSISGPVGAVAGRFNANESLFAAYGPDGGVRIYDLSDFKERAAIVLLDGLQDFVAVAPDGRFDGTAVGISAVGWRTDYSVRNAPLDMLYNDFFYPQLLADIWAHTLHPATTTVLEQLRVPGIQLMMENRLASIQRRNGRPVVCFRELPDAPPVVTADDVTIPFQVDAVQGDPDNPACPYFQPLPNTSAHFDLVNAQPARTNSTISMGAVSPAAQSVLHVVTVGISNYSKSSGFDPLPASDPSVDALTARFNQQRMNGSPFREIRVYPALKDGLATRDGILRELAAVATQARPEDVVLLFFVGHGIIPSGQEMFYYVPYDWSGMDYAHRIADGFSTAQLADAVRNINARRIAIVIDSCQSGGALESLQKVAEAKIRAARATASQQPVGAYLLASATPLAEAAAPLESKPTRVTDLMLGAFPQTAVTPQSPVVVSIGTVFQKIAEGLKGDGQFPLVVSEGDNFPLAYGH